MVELDTLIDERYRVIRLLKQSGRGNVYAAYDKRLQRQVALKVVRPDLLADAATRKRFVREAQVAAQVTHPNLVRTYDAGESPYGPYLVQELLQGYTLDQRMPLPPQRAIGVAVAVAEGLEYLHANGYVHGDIKPANIMLVQEQDRERVVLLDFGLTQANGPGTTTLLATPHYLAPERASGAPATAAADLYALGIVLYEMLTGRVPFDAPQVPSIIAQHRQAPLPSLNVAGPNGWKLEAIVRALTAKQPQARPASAGALRTELRSALDGMLRTRVLEPPPAALPLPSAPPRRRWWPALLLALIPVALALALFAARGLGLDTPFAAQASPSPSAVRVPNVAGLPLNEALQRLQQAGFNTVTQTAVPDAQPAGVVVVTDPPSGETLAPGSQIVLRVSAGPTDSSVGTEAGSSDAPAASVATVPNDSPAASTPAAVVSPSAEAVPTPSAAAVAEATVPAVETVPATANVTSTTTVPDTIVTTLGDGSRRYENTARRFAITLPPTWEIVDPAAPQLSDAAREALAQSSLGGLDATLEALPQAGVEFFALDVAPEAGSAPGTNVNLLPVLPEPTPLDQFIGDVVRQLEGSGLVDGPVEQRRLTLGGSDVEELRFRLRQAEGTGPTITTTQYIFDQDRRNYALTFSCLEENTDAYAPVFEKIAESFAVTE